MLLPKRTKFITREKFKLELNAAEIGSIKQNTNYRTKVAEPCRVIGELNYSMQLELWMKFRMSSLMNQVSIMGSFRLGYIYMHKKVPLVTQKLFCNLISSK